ncbi:hypothetical protein ABFS83_04G107400 [Erythranthe nasuta]
MRRILAGKSILNRVQYSNRCNLYQNRSFWHTATHNGGSRTNKSLGNLDLTATAASPKKKRSFLWPVLICSSLGGLSYKGLLDLGEWLEEEGEKNRLHEERLAKEMTAQAEFKAKIAEAELKEKIAQAAEFKEKIAPAENNEKIIEMNMKADPEESEREIARAELREKIAQAEFKKKIIEMNMKAADKESKREIARQAEFTKKIIEMNMKAAAEESKREIARQAEFTKKIIEMNMKAAAEEREREIAQIKVKFAEQKAELEANKLKLMEVNERLDKLDRAAKEQREYYDDVVYYSIAGVCVGMVVKMVYIFLT